MDARYCCLEDSGGEDVEIFVTGRNQSVCQIVLLVVVLLRAIWMFNKFDIVWLLTGGGPMHGTEHLPILAYRKAFDAFDVGIGATISTISFLILTIAILLFFWRFPIDERK